MRGRLLRNVAIAGLVLASIGLLIPGFHHVRCSVTSEEGPDVSAPCVETFPSITVPIAGALGLLGALVAIGAAIGLWRAGDGRTSARAVLAVAALALLVPTLLPIAGWASAGFDLGIAKPQDGGWSGCTGRLGRSWFWLQTPVCVRWLDLIVTPLGALAGLLALVASHRGSARFTLAALASAAIALLVFAAWLALGLAYLAKQWIVPLAGIALLAGALAILQRAPSPQSA